MTKEEKREYSRRFYKNHKESEKVRTTKWREENRDKVNNHAKVYYQKNKQSSQQRSKKYRESHKEYYAGILLKKNYGMTICQYNELFTNQNGVCVICLKLETKVDPRSSAIKKLSVDHDHKTGKVRGLLCDSCNLALGKFHDDPSLLRRAINYLESFNKIKI